MRHHGTAILHWAIDLKLVLLIRIVSYAVQPLQIAKQNICKTVDKLPIGMMHLFPRTTVSSIVQRTICHCM